MSEISKLLAEVESLKTAVAALTQSSQPDGEKSGGQPDATPEASSIKKAQPKQGLEFGSLQTGSLQTGSSQTGSSQSPDERSLVAEPDASELAERQIAANYSEDLSGTNGPLNQFRAVREIAETTTQAGFDELTISSADGSSVFGDWPFMTLKAGGRKGEVSADPQNFEGPPLPFAISGGGPEVQINSGSIWIISKDHFIEGETITANEGDSIYVNFELEPYAINIAAEGDSLSYIIRGFLPTPVSEPAFSTESQTQFAEIHPDTGIVIKNGKFSIQLGVVGNPVQNRYGPLTVAQCPEAGSIIVQSPAYAFYDPSNPQTG